MTLTTATGATPGVRSIPQRLLGKTGELVPVLGLGTGPGGIGMKDDDAIALNQRALELGITYFDTAPGYGGAHRQLGEVLPPHREGLFLVSKANATDFDEALRIVEQSLKDLRVDRLDLVYVHSVGNLDPEAVLSPKGSLAGLREAQKRGMTRFVGISAHHMAARSARILKAADVDVGMFALNPGDRHTYNFEEKVLPLARAQNTGVAAMKVYGGASEMKYELDGEERFRPTAMAVHGFSDYERAFRYCLDLPGVAVNVIGMYREEEIEQNIELACGYEPLEETELAMLERAGAELGKSWGEHFGPAG